MGNFIGNHIIRKLVIITYTVIYCFTAPAQTISFAIGDWAPYTSSSGKGLAIELVSEICAAAELSPSYIYLPWKRAEFAVKEGQYFGTFPYAQTEERLEYFLFSDPILSAHTVLLYNRTYIDLDSELIRSLEDLSEYRIGIMAGTDFIKDILRTNGAIVEETTLIESTLNKLELGRIDCLVEDYFVALELLKITKNPNIRMNKKIGDYFPVREYRLMISKMYPKAAELLARLNASIAQLPANPTRASMKTSIKASSQ